LEYPTVDRGGDYGEVPAGVYIDTLAMTTEDIDLVSEVGSAVGNAFIIGQDGASLSGYSDDATLTSLGYATQSAITAERESRTANRVVISTATSESPLDHKIEATYSVSGSTAVSDMTIKSTEKFELGNVVFSWVVASA